MKTLISNFFTAQICVVLLICLNFNISKAQLEFSNWIVGKNTILHIEPDGSTSLIPYNAVTGGNNFNYYHILSDKNGKPIIKIGEKNWVYDNGLSMGSDSKSFLMCFMNGDTVFIEPERGHNFFSPFMFKSPDNKYVYVLYKTFNYELKSTTESVCKTQIRCFCKDNFDDTDPGKNFIVHEFIRTKQFEFYKTDYIDSYAELPFFCAMSHTDGKSVWIISKSRYEENAVAIKLTGSEIKEQIYSPWKSDYELDFEAGSFLYPGFRLTDNGRIYTKIPNEKKTMVTFFNQDNGKITKQKYYDGIYAVDYNYALEPSTTGKYLYCYNRKKKKIIRWKTSDLDNGINDKAEEFDLNEILGRQIKYLGAIRIGIDGNIYIKSQPLVVIQNTDDKTPAFKIVQDNIPEQSVCFPNFLYSYELFSCTVDCDRNATFNYQKNHEEIATYEWNFGDGESSAEICPTHKYAKAGNYEVKLEITLKNGCKKVLPSRTISISEAKFQKPKIIAE